MSERFNLLRGRKAEERLKNREVSYDRNKLSDVFVNGTWNTIYL